MQYDLSVLIPSEADRIAIHRVIYEELCLGKVLNESRASFKEIIDRLVRVGAQGVILGCTEISMLVSRDDSQIPLFDTTAIHSRYAVDWALGS